jgi:asparaginyl-tRNA synthetase
MLQGVSIKHLNQHLGEEVMLQGWLYNKRSSGKIQFLILRDGSGLVQGVLVKKEVDQETWAKANSLTQESSLRVWGTVREEPRAVGGYELQVTRLEVISLAAEYPITHKEHGVDFLADRRHLWMRTPRQSAILRIRSEIEHALREFFYQREFILADAPIITPAACEGTTTLFEIDYHGDPANHESVQRLSPQQTRLGRNPAGLNHPGYTAYNRGNPKDRTLRLTVVSSQPHTRSSGSQRPKPYPGQPRHGTDLIME